ncbi:hypothetical protein [Clostridium sp.]|jgi:hypothetical protein|nr:hypothetical protein [Clostridium sp.]MDF2505967.1 hypothetical protein [Clostridium sp.]
MKRLIVLLILSISMLLLLMGCRRRSERAYKSNDNIITAIENTKKVHA